MDLIVPEAFIQYRNKRAVEYNQGNRSDRKFFMDIDCELFEWHMINEGDWLPHALWEVDALVDGQCVDVKFIQKYYNISRQKMVNILQQREFLIDYLFFRWTKRPTRPLQANDEVSFEYIGHLHWRELANAIRVSKKDPFGFYADIDKAIQQGREEKSDRKEYFKW